MDSPSRYDVLAVSVALDVKSPPSATGEVERSANGDVPTPAQRTSRRAPKGSAAGQSSSHRLGCAAGERFLFVWKGAPCSRVYFVA